MIEKISDEVFNSLPSNVKTYIIQLESLNLAISQQNDLLNENFKGIKNKTDIIKQLNYTYKTKEEKYNNIHFYDEGRIASLLWVLGLPETAKDDEIKELIKNV